jgi:hypothetical protein
MKHLLLLLLFLNLNVLTVQAQEETHFLATTHFATADKTFSAKEPM